MAPKTVHDVLDHPEYFRHREKPYRATGIVAHVYLCNAAPIDLNAYATERGLVGSRSAMGKGVPEQTTA